MIVVGIVAFALQTDWGPALTFLASEPSQVLGSDRYRRRAAVPDDGRLRQRVSGFSKDLYTAAAALLGHRRGGLVLRHHWRQRCLRRHLRIVTSDCRDLSPASHCRKCCNGAITRRAFSGATIAAGGALKALIPPSLSMILYCVVARTYIFDVFIAAVIPALITIAANIAAITIVVRMNPDIAPVAPQVSRAEKLVALRRAAPAILLIGVIFVGLYSGIFTVSEAASVAAVVSFVFALTRRTITPNNFARGLRDTALTAGMIYFVLIGSSVFTYFISLAKIPEQLIALLGQVDLPPLGIIVMMLAAYLVLGAIFDELAAMVVTLPFALPIIVHFGYDPVWWAIINVIIVGTRRREPRHRPSGRK